MCEIGFNVPDLCTWQDDVFKLRWSEDRQLQICLCVSSTVFTGQGVELHTEHHLVHKVIFSPFMHLWLDMEDFNCTLLTDT